MWFASGAVLLFAPFPSLAADEAAARAEPVPLDRLRVSPAEAVAAWPGVQDLRLLGVLGRPVYVLTTAAGDRAVSGETDAPTASLTAIQAAEVAAAFGRAPVVTVSGPIAYDQWIVHQGFDHARPMYRVALADGRRTELYVSAQTGEVVQKTQGLERAWNWPGAVVHWLYFTPLRKTFTVWDQTVWWISLIGVLMTVAGIGLGVYRTTKKMRSPRPGFSPFRGWLRWHHILGICASLFVFTWILSGWLSMDHGRLFSRSASPAVRAGRYAGAPLAQASSQISVDELRAVGPATAIRFGVVGGRLVAAAQSSGGPGLVRLAGAEPSLRVPVPLLLAAVHRAWPEAAVSGPVATSLQDFYAKAEGLNPGSEAYRLSGGMEATAYVDPASGRMLAFVDRSRAAYDWIYYGLHTFNFPGLLGLPLLRDVLVLALLALGFALCITSVVVGVRRLQILAAG